MTKIYIAEFTGYYPVGAVAAVKANSPEQAKDLLERELYTMGLAQSVPLEKFRHLAFGDAKVDILLDGDY